MSLENYTTLLRLQKSSAKDSFEGLGVRVKEFRGYWVPGTTASAL